MNKTYLRGDLPGVSNETPPKKEIAGLWFVLPIKERETAGCQYRAAPGTAMTSSGAILPSSLTSER